MNTILRLLMGCALLGVLVLGYARTLDAGNTVVGKDCTFKGKKLFGKVKFVTAFPDIKVQVVTAFPDLKVKWVNAFPDACGKWQPVDAFPDIKIQMVEAFPDIKVQFVDAFPGVP